MTVTESSLTSDTHSCTLLCCVGTKGKVGPSDQPVASQNGGRALAEDKTKASAAWWAC